MRTLRRTALAVAFATFVAPMASATCVVSNAENGGFVVKKGNKYFIATTAEELATIVRENC